MKRSWAGEVRNVSLLVASAVNSEGFREILGICEDAKEDKSGSVQSLSHIHHAMRRLRFPIAAVEIAVVWPHLAVALTIRQMWIDLARSVYIYVRRYS
jgi:hypothetical protein